MKSLFEGCQSSCWKSAETPIEGASQWSYTDYIEFWEQVTEVLLISQRKASNDWQNRCIFSYYAFGS